MANKLVMRNEWAAYAEVEGTEGKAYALIGEGFTSLTESKNPREYSRQYVHEKTERTDVTGYASSLAYTCDTYSEDPVIQHIVKVTDNEYVGTEAQIKVCSVNKWVTIGGVSGTYEAYERTYAIIPDAKGDGTDALVYSGTLRAVGDSVKGEFNEETKKFTASEM